MDPFKEPYSKYVMRRSGLRVAEFSETEVVVGS